MSEIKSNNRILNVNVKKYKELKSQIAALNEQLEKCETNIRKELNKYNLFEYKTNEGNIVKLTPAERQQFNIKEFKTKHPGIAKKYMTIVVCKPRLNIK